MSPSRPPSSRPLQLDDVSKAMPVVDGLVNYVPHFLALSASSPYWAGVDTGSNSDSG